MNKSFIFGLCTGIAITAISIVTYLPGLAEAIYSVPPTVAFSNVTILPKEPWPNDTRTSIEAISYRDIAYIRSDGSIELNFTHYP